MAKKQENEVQTVDAVLINDQPAPPAREEPKKLDKTVSGGRYIVNGRLVNCNNEPIEE
jgi:hypothetical protein